MARAVLVVNSQMILLVNTLINLGIAYLLIKYTKTIESKPQCRDVEPFNREFLYWGGVIILANVILGLLLKML